MDLDALASARAVREPVASTADVHAAFDSLTYYKGAAVLSTIQRWVGDGAFVRGLHDYLASNAFTSVASDKLFAALDRATGKDVTAMASGYLDVPGVPVVSSGVVCDGRGRWHAELAQEPWRPLGSRAASAPDQTWTVPVCVRAQGEKKELCADLAFGAPSLVAGRGCPSWLHPNSEASYYRFSLPEEAYVKLAAARAQLDPIARLTLLTNAWADVRAGKLLPDVMLKLLPAFDRETTRGVVDQIIAIVTTMSDVLVEDEAREAFRRFAAARVAPRKASLGWAKDARSRSEDDAMLRRTVLTAMADVVEDAATLREAEQLAEKWLADPRSVDEDTASVALDVGTRRAPPSRLAALRKVASAAPTREDRIIALKAMVGFDDAALVEQALDVALTDEIATQDVRYVLNAALGRRRTRPIAERWVRRRWVELRRKLPGALGAGLVNAAGAVCTRADVADAEVFYTPRAGEIDGAPRALAQALERAALCAELRLYGASSLSRALLGRRPRR